MTINHIYKCFLECESISTDSRKIVPNSMFFALKGENFNGNAYAQSALENGAKYCIIDEKEYATNDQFLVVDDVLKTLQE